MLEFARDEDVEGLHSENVFEKEKNRFRKLLIGNCKLMDPKMEKNAAYEFTPGVRNADFNSIFRKMIT